LSRHRKIRLSRSKAIVIAAAGTLSVATGASAAAASSQGTRGHTAGSDRPTEIAHEAAGAPRLAVADQLARPVAEAGNQPGNATLAQHALRLRLTQTRLTQTRDAIAHRQAARQRAAEPAASKAAARPGQTAAAAVPAASGSPRQVAQAMLGSFGWSSGQFSCLDPLWEHESRWSVTAANPGSGAFGIPQALPGSRMASAGPDWQTSAATQITWGLRYIKDTYGSPCAAWSHAQATGWY
jgi:hypothetical protein